MNRFVLILLALLFLASSAFADYIKSTGTLILFDNSDENNPKILYIVSWKAKTTFSYFKDEQPDPQIEFDIKLPLDFKGLLELQTKGLQPEKILIEDKVFVTEV